MGLWEYMPFLCSLCKKQFPTKRGLKKHFQIKHNEHNPEVGNANNDSEEILFTAEDPSTKLRFSDTKITVNENGTTNEIRIESDEKVEESKVMNKMRFKEVTKDRPKNEEWVNLVHSTEEEEIFVAEVKENQDNGLKVQEAKEKN